MIQLHNAMWPGIVGKEEGTPQSPISLNKMLDLTSNATFEGLRYDGVDLFLFDPHIAPSLSDTELRTLADTIAQLGFKVGSLVAPVWQGTMGGSAFGNVDERKNFLKAVRYACKVAHILNEHGVREYGVIRIDSAGTPQDFLKNELENSKRLSSTFREAGQIAHGHGERLAAEGEICWGGMHSWKHMLRTLEETDMPETVGFQADLAHTYLYLLGYNAPEHKLLKDGYSDEEFWAAYTTMTDALRPWTIDFHLAQNDGSVHGTGDHDKTGRHCIADDPNGKMNIAKCASMWLEGHQDRGIKHICWDGCMFDNSVLENSETWNAILQAMVQTKSLLAQKN